MRILAPPTATKRVIVAVLAPLLVASCASTAAPARTAGASHARRSSARVAFAEAAAHEDAAAYTRQAGRYLKKRDRSLRMRMPEPLVLQMRRGEQDLTISLDDPWTACHAIPRACDDASRQYLESVLAAVQRSPADNRPTPERLRLAVRGEATIAAYESRIGPLLTLPLVAGLVGLVMVDFPESAQPLPRAALPALGLDESGAIARAKANVLAELGPLRAPRTPAPGVMLVIGEGQFYASSWMFDVDGWSALEQRTGSPLLITVSSQGPMIVSNLPDPAGARPAAVGPAEPGGHEANGTILCFRHGHFEALP